MENTISDQKRKLELHVMIYSKLIKQNDRLSTTCWRKYDENVEKGNPEGAKEMMKLMRKVRRLRKKCLAALEEYKFELSELHKSNIG